MGTAQGEELRRRNGQTPEPRLPTPQLIKSLQELLIQEIKFAPTPRFQREAEWPAALVCPRLRESYDGDLQG